MVGMVSIMKVMRSNTIGRDEGFYADEEKDWNTKSHGIEGIM